MLLFIIELLAPSIVIKHNKYDDMSIRINPSFLYSFSFSKEKNLQESTDA
jgi:hypothetical protein